MQSRSSPFHALLYLVAKQKGMVIIMIEHLAQKVSKYYSDRLIIDPSKQKIYSYGFESPQLLTLLVFFSFPASLKTSLGHFYLWLLLYH